MALLTGLLTHSHCLLFLINSMVFSLCLERTSAFIFVTLTERLVLSLSAGRRPPHYMYSDVDVNSQSFSAKTDSVISHLISLFSLTTLLLPCTLLPSISSRLSAWGIRGASLLYYMTTGPEASSIYSDIHPFTWLESAFSKLRPIVDLSENPEMMSV